MSSELWESDGSFHSQGGAGWRTTLADHREDVVLGAKAVLLFSSKGVAVLGEWCRQDLLSLWACPLGGQLLESLLPLCFHLFCVCFGSGIL